MSTVSKLEPRRRAACTPQSLAERQSLAELKPELVEPALLALLERLEQGESSGN